MMISVPILDSLQLVLLLCFFSLLFLSLEVTECFGGGFFMLIVVFSVLPAGLLCKFFSFNYYYYYYSLGTLFCGSLKLQVRFEPQVLCKIFLSFFIFEHFLDFFFSFMFLIPFLPHEFASFIWVLVPFHLFN